MSDGGKISLKQRIVTRWRNFKDDMAQKRYFIRYLRECGCLRFGDRFRIIFAKDLDDVRSKVINKLQAAYESLFSVDIKRSSQ